MGPHGPSNNNAAIIQPIQALSYHSLKKLYRMDVGGSLMMGMGIIYISGITLKFSLGYRIEMGIKWHRLSQDIQLFQNKVATNNIHI